MSEAIYFDRMQLIDGSYAEVCDSVARAAIANGKYFLGATTTELTDGSATNPIMIAGESVTAANGNVVVYGRREFVFATADNKWHELGFVPQTIDVSVDDGVLEINLTDNE